MLHYRCDKTWQQVRFKLDYKHTGGKEAFKPGNESQIPQLMEEISGGKAMDNRMITICFKNLETRICEKKQG